MYALLGPLGAAFLFLAYVARDSGGRAMALGLVGLVCFGLMFAATPIRQGAGDCFVDWDARANRTVCN
jgi:hypothetical protein